MHARKRAAIALALVGLVALIPLTQATAGEPVELTATLTGAAEVPGPGDPNGSGGAVIDADSANREVCFELDWQAIGRPFAAHIHRGGSTVAGPVRVELFASRYPLPHTIDEVEGCVKRVHSDLIDRIVANPAQYYVNVHTPAYPGGAIRGQLALST